MGVKRVVLMGGYSSGFAEGELIVSESEMLVFKALPESLTKGMLAITSCIKFMVSFSANK